MADLLLGAALEPGTNERSETLVTLPSGDLTTHGVIVGMTGSGKTGLGIVLIEECLGAGIPALLIDPKGDLTNLALVFPSLSPADFRPWIDEAAARTAGVTADEHAARQAEAWRNGLAGWGIGPERLQALRDAADVTIYTPGSTAGVPLNLVGSLQPPPEGTDPETLADEVEGYVSGLLGLVGIAADPLSSREHILLTNLIAHAWGQGRALDLPTLVAQVPQPPIRKLGVFDVDQFFPADDRMQLAMRLNGLLASPSFAAWAEGEPIDLDRLLRTADGRARAAVITTAHLSDEERQFVTSLLLGELVTWMRRQTGTSELRVLVYLDEVAGYLPPTANPPTKPPIMTLMKQARAFGVGVVLATQNPVDVDYKALSNAGTWLIGRLQTERDRDRLLDGMRSVAGGVDLPALAATISGLPKRGFVLRRAGSDHPEVLTTRWAMSYLRGPLTRDQIAALTGPRANPTPAPAEHAAVTPAPADLTATTPAAPPAAIPVCFLAPGAPWATAVGAAAVGAAAGTTLRAGAVARVHLRYDEARADLVHDEDYELVLPRLAERPDLAAAVAIDYDERDLAPAPPPGATYELPDAPIDRSSWWTSLERDLAAHLVQTRRLEVLVNRPLALWSRVGESPADFAARCATAAGDRADEAAAALRERYETRLARQREALDEARARAIDLADEQQARTTQDTLSAAGSLLGGLLGGRRSARSLARDVSRVTGGSSGSSRVAAAERKADTAADRLSELESDLAEDLAGIQATWLDRADDIEVVPVPLERTDVRVTDLRLVWLPTEP